MSEKPRANEDEVDMGTRVYHPTYVFGGEYSSDPLIKRIQTVEEMLLVSIVSADAMNAVNRSRFRILIAAIVICAAIEVLRLNFF